MTSSGRAIVRRAVQSSNIAEVGYDEASRELEVQFHHGGVYRYEGVSPATYAEFLAADSLGSFLHARIKPAHTARRIPAAG